jgi:hypothetical protein
MCLTCHEQPPLNPTDIVEVTDEMLAAAHGDDNPRCVRAYDLGTGGDFELRCIDCGEIVEGTDHCCYD